MMYLLEENVIFSERMLFVFWLHNLQKYLEFGQEFYLETKVT